MLEFAIAAGLLLVLSAGGLDLGRALSSANEASGMARAGMRVGIVARPGPTSDIGAAIRGEYGNSLQFNWGTASTSNVGTGDCQDSNPLNSVCGDPQGCTGGSAFWAAGVTACFATRNCLYASGSCTSFDPWNTRPDGRTNVVSPARCPLPGPCWNASFAGGTHIALQVRVVLRYAAIAPFVGPLVGNNGTIFIARDAVGQPLY